jgi:hypothetical protein
VGALGQRKCCHTCLVSIVFGVGVAEPFAGIAGACRLGPPLTPAAIGVAHLLLCCFCRSYILDAIDSSVDMINDGIILLQQAAPNPKLFPNLQKMRVRAQTRQHAHQSFLACPACLSAPELCKLAALCCRAAVASRRT